MATTELAVMKAVGKLMAMPFYPATEPLVKVALFDEIPRIVESDEQLEWLVGRVTNLYKAWPGLSEIRAVYCARYKPRDGVNVYSGVYPDGIPSERPAVRPLRELPPGHNASADARLERSIAMLADVKDLNRLARPAPASPGLPPEKRITQADIDREVARLHEGKRQQADAHARQEIEE